MDLHRGELKHETFITLNCDMDILREAARTLIKIYDRLILTNEDLGDNGEDH